MSGEDVQVEWDEPGAGGILVNGKRVISFGIDTDWSDHWNPQVNEDGLRFMDALPRLVQEREIAWQMYREAQAETAFPIAEGEVFGRSRTDEAVS